MISKNLAKYIKTLGQKKGREKDSTFVAEGPKVVGDLMEVFPLRRLIAVEEWYKEHQILPRKDLDCIVTEEELRKVSFLQHPQQVMALFPIPTIDMSGLDFHHQLFLALDGVQDPGNLGTIIRIADWFGITTIFCSHNTADAFNPKVVQATMGSIARVKVIYTDLCQFTDELPADIPVYGTFLDGKNLYTESLTNHGIIVMGNEGNGISDEMRRRITRRLLIPSYPPERPTAESLNVAIATAITCAAFRRMTY